MSSVVGILKSNMDRFIAKMLSIIKYLYGVLKSNMDRFIEKVFKKVLAVFTF